MPAAPTPGAAFDHGATRRLPEFQPPAMPSAPPVAPGPLPPPVSPAGDVPPPQSPRRRWLAVAALILGTIVVAGVAVWQSGLISTSDQAALPDNPTPSSDANNGTTTPDPPEGDGDPAPSALAPVDRANIVASASSTLAPVEDLSYTVDNLFDGKNDTAWNHDSQLTDPIGEWILLRLDPAAPVERMDITNGYAKSSEIFFRNHRAKNVTITVRRSDGTSEIQSIVLLDSQQPQPFEIDPGEPVTEIEIHIDSIYAGSRWDDLAVSEISLWSSGR